MYYGSSRAGIVVDVGLAVGIVVALGVGANDGDGV